MTDMFFSASARILVFLLGTAIGSFVNVVIVRLPAGQSVVRPRSRCPACGQQIAWYDNLPLASYLFLRGRCRRCAVVISRRYFFVELLTGLLFLAVWQRFGPGSAAAVFAAYAAAMVAISAIDAEHMIIPDRISLPGLVLGLGYSFINPIITPWDALFGATAGFGILYGIARAYFLLTGREGMGGGDFKLLGMIGAFLGWQSLPFVIFASSLAGSVWGLGALAASRIGGKSWERWTRIPYGPFLAGASLVYLLVPSLVAALNEWLRTGSPGS